MNKTIFSYWHKTPPPSLVLECVASWAEFLPDYKVVMFHEGSDILKFLPPAARGQILQAHRADILRLWVLFHFGGVWLDATVFAGRGAAQILEQHQHRQLWGTRLSPTTVKIENWMMLAARPGSELVGQWLRLLVELIAAGDTCTHRACQNYGSGYYRAYSAFLHLYDTSDTFKRDVDAIPFASSQPFSFRCGINFLRGAPFLKLDRYQRIVVRVVRSGAFSAIVAVAVLALLQLCYGLERPSITTIITAFLIGLAAMLLRLS